MIIICKNHNKIPLWHTVSTSIKVFPFPQQNASNKEKFCRSKYVANLLQCKHLYQTNPKD